MQVNKIATVFALSAVFAASGAMADVRDGSLVGNDGQTYSAPATTVASSLSRTQVQSQAQGAVRASIANPIVAGGLGGNVDTQTALSQASRDDLRAQAIEAVRISIQNPIAASGLGA